MEQLKKIWNDGLKWQVIRFVEHAQQHNWVMANVYRERINAVLDTLCLLGLMSYEMKWKIHENLYRYLEKEMGF